MVEDYNQNNGYFPSRRVENVTRYGYKWACYLYEKS